MLLGVDRVGGAHILHSLFSVPVGPYDPDRRLFGCRGELPTERLLAITKIPVAFFGELHAVNDVSQDDHRVHLEGSPPSIWKTMPCERQSERKRDEASLSGYSPFPLQIPPHPSSIWKGASARF